MPRKVLTSFEELLNSHSPAKLLTGERRFPSRSTHDAEDTTLPGVTKMRRDNPEPVEKLPGQCASVPQKLLHPIGKVPLDVEGGHGDVDVHHELFVGGTHGDEESATGLKTRR